MGKIIVIFNTVILPDFITVVQVFGCDWAITEISVNNNIIIISKISYISVIYLRSEKRCGQILMYINTVSLFLSSYWKILSGVVQAAHRPLADLSIAPKPNSNRDQRNTCSPKHETSYVIIYTKDEKTIERRCDNNLLTFRVKFLITMSWTYIDTLYKAVYTNTQPIKKTSFIQNIVRTV